MAEKYIKTPGGKNLYVFIPACCYAGNQFEVRAYDYSPRFTVEDAQVDMPVTITDVPRLEKDGSGKIQVTTGDAATPCIGVFSPAEKRGLLVFTVQQLQDRNIGLAYENGEICLTWPARREKIYRGCHLHENLEAWEDIPADIPCKILNFSCNSLADFFRVFFENRKILQMDSERPPVRSYSQQIEIQTKKFNEMNWFDNLGFYMVGTNKTRYQVWQPGWVGGAISGYALMKLGGALEYEREYKTLSFLFSTQCESGFFHGIVDAEGKTYSDAFRRPGADHWHLIRKSADVLYYLFKHFAWMNENGKEIPVSFQEGAKKTADGFVQLWKKYKQFGQFVDVHTGEICVGGSTCAGIAPAGLTRAFQFFQHLEYLQVAKESAEAFYFGHLGKGYTTGGPGDMLQCVDSESAFGLLESFVVLYEVTEEKKWLEYARECAHYCSSWVVSYNYQFPPESEFGRHHMKTVGSVFANIQNKHAAPGICTLSGDSLFRLWQWTQEPLYLELIKDIALTIGQYLSTEDAPIYDWDLTPADREDDNTDLMKKHQLPAGFICERVNMSDWETDQRIGGVFQGSCWSETSNLLTLAEVIPLLSLLK